MRLVFSGSKLVVDDGLSHQRIVVTPQRFDDFCSTFGLVKGWKMADQFSQSRKPNIFMCSSITSNFRM